MFYTEFLEGLKRPLLVITIVQVLSILYYETFKAKIMV